MFPFTSSQHSEDNQPHDDSLRAGEYPEQRETPLDIVRRTSVGVFS